MSAVQRFPEPASSVRNATHGEYPGAERDPLGSEVVRAER
jgi:hypothetical protein